MVLPMWLNNLIAYSIQIAILASAGALLSYVFRLKAPKPALIYWQVLLLACVLIPAFQSWKHPIQKASGRTTLAAGRLGFDISGGTPIERGPAAYFSPESIAVILITGASLRLVWLAVGVVRLRRVRRNSRYSAEKPAILQDVPWFPAIQPAVYFSDQIESPATFGMRAPAVILPFSFKQLSEDSQRAILCHELLHIRRRDWGFIIAEEIIRSIYWFHPAFWWLLGRIRLSREQAVDAEVVRLTGSKQPYLNSLLEIARARVRPTAVPAPLFLRERHLVQRVALLLKEASMSRKRLIASMAGMFVLRLCTIEIAAAWFPLTGAPTQVQQQNSDVKAPQKEPIKVGGNVQESKLIYKVEPTYPEEAKANRVQGKVILVATANEEGLVSDTKVVSGHPLFSQAAIDAVKQWRYSPTLLNGEPVPVTFTVTVIFRIAGSADMLMPGGIGTTPSQYDVFYIRVLAAPGSPTSRAVIKASTPYMSYEGRQYYAVTEDISAPELALNQDRLRALAASGVSGTRKPPFVYWLFISETGRIVGLRGIQAQILSQSDRNPPASDISNPEIEDELAKTQVIAPGRRGSEPVPVWLVVMIERP